VIYPASSEARKETARATSSGVPNLPADIDPAAPLFGSGLGLDSIDALELVVALEKTYGIRIPDEDVGKEAFASVNALADYILRNMTHR